MMPTTSIGVIIEFDSISKNISLGILLVNLRKFNQFKRHYLIIVLPSFQPFSLAFTWES